ncbi:hypothetical protein EBL_c01130 [Shimwellia blattae DSM 4481 = NBRC 105725]|uniref:Uncharacterized protein n=1 Tax=Shimwellia blattae (strain ATCC 29907 / DSM 4481 / JCM 1650 / NBRC 105725 / CDC 9005-74) TaxID=630626 RepID=I2B3Z5_SHIBC|nr:hypothetical protein EBL_c01130 [Shimwellia blattae DSM 4481 = NBRC 105725]
MWESSIKHYFGCWLYRARANLRLVTFPEPGHLTEFSTLSWPQHDGSKVSTGGGVFSCRIA